MQYSFGVSSSNIKTSEQDTSNNANYNPLIGINLSFATTSSINEKISLVSEFSFNQKGYIKDWDAIVNEWDMSTVRMQEKSKENFLQFTQLVEFHVNEKLSLSFGPYIECFLEGRYLLRDEQGNDIYNDTFSDQNGAFFNNDYGIGFKDRINYGINLASSYQIYKNLLFRAGYSITDILNNDKLTVFNKMNYLFLNISLKIEL